MAAALSEKPESEKQSGGPEGDVLEARDASSELDHVRKDLLDTVAQLKRVVELDERRTAGLLSDEEKSLVSKEQTLLARATERIAALEHLTSQGSIAVLRADVSSTAVRPGQAFDLRQALLTPAGAMLGVLEELGATSPTAVSERRRLLDHLEFSGQHLEVNMSMLGLHPCHDLIQPKPVPLWKLVEDAISMAWQDRDYHLGVEVSYFLEQAVPEQVLLDGGRLRQVLVGLLSNAFRFTNSGDVILYVSQSAVEPVAPATALTGTGEQQTAVLRFGIHDTGIGMSPETMATLFESFSGSSRRATIGGEAERTCLGLHVCNFLIGLMEGKMLLESQFCLGTSVYITVPQTATQLHRSQGHERESFPISMSSTLTPFRISETAAAIPASWRPTEHHQAVLTGKRVVILDSSKFLVRGLCKLCEQMKMTIAYHNVEAHEPFIWLRTEASKAEFDVVMMDLWQFGSAVTDETLARWAARGVAVMLMCPTEDWNRAARTTQDEAKQKRESQEKKGLGPKSKESVHAPSPDDIHFAPAFVTHLSKPVIFSGVADCLVLTLEAARLRGCRPHASPVGLESGKPEPTRRQDTKQEQEVIAASEWHERAERDALDTTTSARAVARQSERDSVEHEAQEPLLLSRETEKQKGGTAHTDWLARKDAQEATGGSMLFASSAATGASADMDKSLPMKSSASVSADVGKQRAPAERKILVVEDNFVNQRLLLSMLGRLGYKADVADNGRQAVENASLFHYPMILMDVSMPVLSGAEATRMILKSYREGKGPMGAASEPVVLSITAASDHRDCYEAGMKDVVGKPFTLDTLREKIEKWMPAAATTLQ